MYPTHRHIQLDSTNVEAKRLAEEGAVQGTAVLAAHQTAGRGRLRKTWYTVPDKGLYCSIIVRPALVPEDYPKLTLTAGLAVATVLGRVSGKQVQLKWPNDVYFNGRKCAGILAESSSLATDPITRFGIIGIGINVNQALEDFPPELQGIVTTLSLEKGSSVVIEELFEDVRRELLLQIDRMETHGFRVILEDWKKHDYLCGKQMECVDIKGAIIRGLCMGPDEDGVLHVMDKSGKQHEVLSGDVRIADKSDTG